MTIDEMVKTLKRYRLKWIVRPSGIIRCAEGCPLQVLTGLRDIDDYEREAERLGLPAKTIMAAADHSDGGLMPWEKSVRVKLLTLVEP